MPSSDALFDSYIGNLQVVLTKYIYCLQGNFQTFCHCFFFTLMHTKKTFWSAIPVVINVTQALLYKLKSGVWLSHEPISMFCIPISWKSNYCQFSFTLMHALIFHTINIMCMIPFYSLFFYKYSIMFIVKVDVLNMTYNFFLIILLACDNVIVLF